MNTRDKTIITGLYLSKYNEKGLEELGFTSFQQAFNVLGYSLNSKPATIKNYRDEFDPLFPNNRKGWHTRPMREYCKSFFDEYNTLDFLSFSHIIKSFFIENFEIEKFIEKIEGKDYSETVAKRLLTGKAAEEYFKSKYKEIPTFSPYSITDTTLMACGFDYKLSLGTRFLCVEVKGLNEHTGTIQLTEKEFLIAQQLKSNYCLFIVKNFKEKPIHDFVFDPLNSALQFKKAQKKIIQTTFTTII